MAKPNLKSKEESNRIDVDKQLAEAVKKCCEASTKAEANLTKQKLVKKAASQTRI